MTKNHTLFYWSCIGFFLLKFFFEFEIKCMKNQTFFFLPGFVKAKKFFSQIQTTFKNEVQFICIHFDDEYKNTAKFMTIFFVNLEKIYFFKQKNTEK